jgi:hypothetical protein
MRMPNHLPVDTLGEMILAGVQRLRVEGKFGASARTAINSGNATAPPSILRIDDDSLKFKLEALDQ